MDPQQNRVNTTISVRPLLHRPGERKEVSLTLDAETASSFGLCCAQLPQVKGVLENRAGVLFFRYTAECVLDLVCDRCLSSVTYPVCEEFEHIVVTELAVEQNDSDYLLASDAMLDVAEVVMTDLRLSLPSKTLCSEACLGLCPHCGQNRNENPCSCCEEA